MWKRIALFTLTGCCAVLASSGCGGGAPKASQHASEAGSRTGATTSTAPLATARARTGVGASKKPDVVEAGRTPTTIASPSARPAGTAKNVVEMPSDFVVTVEKACVHAQETQAFTVTGGVPGQLLIYDTAYADGTDDYTTHYGSGSGKDKFDGSGRYRTTFVLAGKVPPGTAYLSVASARGSQLVQARTTFVIKPLTQPCS